MSYRLASLKMGVAIAALALGSPCLCTAQAQSKARGRSIEFSNPKNGDVTTNLNQLNSKKDSLKQLEEDLYRSVHTFSDESSLDAIAPPPEHFPLPVVPSKRLKEQLDRRKNAFLLTPEDLVHAPTLEETLKVHEYGADGREKQTKIPLELYYERQDAKRAAALKPSRLQSDENTSETLTMSSAHDIPAANDDTTLPPALEQKEQALKKLFGSDNAESLMPAVAPKRSSFSDIFGQGDITPSKEKALEHKKYMEEYSTIFETSRARPATADALKNTGSTVDHSHKLANPFGVSDASPMGVGTLGLINPLNAPPTASKARLMKSISPTDTPPELITTSH
jgi:hypothetical protein